MGRVSDPVEDDYFTNCLGNEIPERFRPLGRPEVDSDDEEDFADWTVTELKDLLRKLGLRVSGKKADLVERLSAFYEEDLMDLLEDLDGDYVEFDTGSLFVIERENENFQWRGIAQGGGYSCFIMTEEGMKDNLIIDLESSEEVKFLFRWYPHGYECHGKSSLVMDLPPVELERSFPLPLQGETRPTSELVSEPMKWARETSRRVTCVASALCGGLWGGGTMLLSTSSIQDEEDPRVFEGELCWDYWSSNQDRFDPMERYLRTVVRSFFYPFWEISEKRTGAYSDLCEVFDFEYRGDDLAKKTVDSLASLGSYYLIPIHLMEYRFMSLCKSMEILFTLLYCIDKEYPRLRIPAKERFSTEWKNGYQYLSKKIEYVGQRYGIKTDSETTDGVRKVRNQFAHDGAIWDQESHAELTSWLLEFADKALRHALAEMFSMQGIDPGKRLCVFRADIPVEFRFTTVRSEFLLGY